MQQLTAACRFQAVQGAEPDRGVITTLVCLAEQAVDEYVRCVQVRPTWCCLVCFGVVIAHKDA